MEFAITFLSCLCLFNLFLYLIESHRRKFWYKQYIFFKDLAKKSLDELHTANREFEKTVKQRNFYYTQLAKTDFPFHLHSNYE